MNFVKLPENGASWAGSLCYTIDTESSEPQDLVVEILDRYGGSVIGTKRLYGVTVAEIDIAPYVRSAVSERSTESVSGVILSPSAMNVVLRVGDVVSEQRILFRAAIDCSIGQMLSEQPQSAVVERGEEIRLTALGRESVRMWIIDKRTMTYSPMTAIHTLGMPVEIVIPTATITGESVPIAVNVLCDEAVHFEYNFTVTGPSSSTFRVMWYNTRGGVECYSFAHAVRMRCEAEVPEHEALAGRCGMLPTVMTYRLLSDYESHEQMERLLGIISSPVVYECQGKESKPLKLLSRKVDFDDHGRLRRMELIVEKGV